MLKFTINDIAVEAEPGWTVLETAREYGIEIPTLCFHEAVQASGACRLCMVELREGDWVKLVASCVYPAKDGLNIYTESERITNVRRWIFEMLLSECPASEQIREMAAKYGVASTRFAIKDPEQDCIMCGLCTRVCAEVVGVYAISTQSRGVYKRIGSPFMEPNEACVACGSCVSVCPTGAMAKRIDLVRGRLEATQTNAA
ncbi:MAG: (2Fe-2S)-binding protein [Desulfatibacillum sp.]|nr:(2Fe-2S)-binding protein [Desulfatibacillum sp.]